MPSMIKMRSASVEDLGNIVKQMIDGVLEDNDQVAKLRQAVFEEYYLKKMQELKQVKAEIDADHKLNEKARKSQINTPDSKLTISHKLYNFEIGDTESGNIKTSDVSPSRDVINDSPPNESVSKRSNSHELFAEKFNGTTPADCLPSEVAVIKSSKSSTTLNSQKDGEKTAASNFMIAELNPPVVRVMKRQKYVRIPQEDDLQVANIHNSTIALGLANYNTTIDLTQTVINSVKNKEQIQSAKNASSNMEIIEWRSNVLWKGTSEQNCQLGKARQIPVQFKSKGEIAFENWKKEKTNVYHRIFRDEQKRKRLDQAMRAEQLQKKEAANEAYLYWRRQQDACQKLRNTRKRVLVQMECQKLQSSEKHKANSQAFKIWKRQKDAKLREQKMYTIAYNEQSNLRQQSKPQKPEPGVHVAFNMWLDQLDCVLHQKYLRERRYLVHSFYCQPAYFGSAALRTR